MTRALKNGTVGDKENMSHAAVWQAAYTHLQYTLAFTLV